MSFRPAVGQDMLSIGGVGCGFAEHPRSSGMPRTQENRHAVLCRLSTGAERRTVKVYRPPNRLRFLVSQDDGLAAFADLVRLSTIVPFFLPSATEPLRAKFAGLSVLLCGFGSMVLRG